MDPDVELTTDAQCGQVALDVAARAMPGPSVDARAAGPQTEPSVAWVSPRGPCAERSVRAAYVSPASTTTPGTRSPLMTRADCWRLCGRKAWPSCEEHDVGDSEACARPRRCSAGSIL